jgi:hypothetical protein
MVSSMVGTCGIRTWATSRSFLLVKGRDNWRIVFLLLLAATCVGFAAWNLRLAFNAPSQAPCTLVPEPANHGNIDRSWYLIGVPLGLLGGRVLGRGRARTKRGPGNDLVTPQGIILTSETDPRDHLGISQNSRNGWGKVARAVIVQALIVLFISVALAGLLYETIGVAASNDPWPLTFLVRCLNEGSQSHLTSASTLAVTVGIAFLIGSWFWPERSGVGAPGI